jgi:hypothetical protein
MKPLPRSLIRKWVPALLLIYIPPLLVLGFVVWLSWITHEPIGHFTRDPAAIAGTNSHWGMISNLGVIFWATTVGICGFCSVLLRGKPDTLYSSSFFLFGCFLTSLLLFDDLFMAHEMLSGTWLSGKWAIRERYTLGTYLVITVVFIVTFRKQIMQSDAIFLASAFGLFALSLGIDLLPEHILSSYLQVVEDGHHLLEDGAKFLGIVGWFGYFFRVGRKTLEKIGNHTS